MSSQKITVGSVRKSIVRLLPRSMVKNPKVNVPRIAPIAFMLPIQESCSFDNGPVVSGVSSDRSMGKAVAGQPIIEPCAVNIIFAKMLKNSVSHHYFMQQYFTIFTYNGRQILMFGICEMIFGWCVFIAHFASLNWYTQFVMAPRSVVEWCKYSNCVLTPEILR